MIADVSKILALGALMLSGSLMAFGLAPAEPITIKTITENGSGCPLGTVAKNVSPDNQAFTVTFSEFIAEAGPGVSRRDNRKNCQLTLALNVPQGWQFSIARFDHRGFAFLDDDTRGTYTTSYYFQGDPRTASYSDRLNGYFDDDFQFQQVFGVETFVWSPCGVERALNINTSIRVRASGDAEAVMGGDSIDGEIRQIWGVSWRRCRR